MKIKLSYIDGLRLRDAFIAGGTWLIRHKDHLNRINVFPVADRDTGTNLEITFGRTIRRIKELGDRSLFATAKNIAKELIIEARGNCGVIFSQFFTAFAKGIGNNRRIHPPQFLNILKDAINKTYDGLENPKEGTILTVIRESVENTIERHFHEKDLKVVLDRLHHYAKESLAKTKYMLPQLRKAKVVDAGGLAYVLFLEGILELLKEGRHIIQSVAIQTEDTEEPQEPVITERPNYRYCTEAVIEISDRGVSSSRIRETIRDLGDSVVVVGQDQTFHVHIHTDNPDEVYARLTGFSVLLRKKVQDMIEQWKSSKRKRLGVVLDSTSDFPIMLKEKYSVHIVPQQILLDGKVYRDGIDIQLKDVLDALVGGKSVTTSQATPEDMKLTLENALKNFEHVFFLTLSSKLSGTYLNAQQVASEFKNRVTVFDTLSISLGTSLMAVTVLELAEQGYSKDEILTRLKMKRDGALLFFSLPTLKYLIRGGRVGKVQGKIGSLIGLRLLMALENGVIVKKAAALTEKGIRKKVKKLFLKNVPRDKPYDFAVAWNTEQDILDEIEPFIRQNFKVNRFFTGTLTPVIGVHTGPGAWGVFASPVVD